MSSAESTPIGETDNQRQARLRRERRNAKIQAGGSERLNKITSLSGRPAAAEAELSRTPSPAAASARRTQPQPPRPSVRPANDDDPDEVDISRMFSKPPGEASVEEQQDMLRQMLAASGPPPQPGAGSGMQQPGADDPMMQMMQQMLGGVGGAGPGGLPEGLAGLFGGQPAEPQRNDAYVWRLLHAVFAVVLGIYAAVGSTFTGSPYERMAVNEQRLAPKMFYIFVTAELMLQSSRYFLDKGQLPASGILGTVGRLLPEPYSGYIRTVGRYSIIWSTIVTDATLIVFILGCMAWWKNGLVSP